MKLLGLALIFSAITSAQLFSGGLKVGGPLTDAISLAGGGDNFVTNNHYIIGPYGEVHLPAGFSVEVDALYRSFSAHYVGESAVSGGMWEFPVLAKKRLLKGPVRPYVDGGLLLSHLTGSYLADVGASPAHASNYGIALGAGAEVHALFLRVSPEIRYDGFVFHDFSDNSFVQSNRNQVMVLVGIGF